MVFVTGSSEGPKEQVADGHTALTMEDLKLLKKEFGDDFTDLLLPGYQVMLTEVLGEGMLFYVIVCIYICFIEGFCFMLEMCNKQLI